MESNKCISITAWNDYEITLDYKPSIIFAKMISYMYLQNFISIFTIKIYSNFIKTTPCRQSFDFVLYYILIYLHINSNKSND